LKSLKRSVPGRAEQYAKGSFLPFQAVLQAFFKLFEGLRSVADPVFYFRRKLGNGAPEFRNKEDGIISESVSAGALPRNSAVQPALE